MYTLETSNGSVTISKNVIGKIVEEAVAQFDGKVFISSNKGKISKRSSKLGSADDMDISVGTKGIDVRVFIVIRFGTSIGRVTNQLMEEIPGKVKAFTGLELNSVAIVVTGLMSKHLAKRYIEVKS